MRYAQKMAIEDFPTMRYLVFQHEVSQENLKPHYQCYVEMARNVRHTAVAKALTLPKDGYALCTRSAIARRACAPSRWPPR